MEKNKVEGYKSFEKGLVAIDGTKFEVGNTYHCDDGLKVMKTGFHFCKNIEDTFRYFKDVDSIEVCEVIGFGDVITYDDEYNGYYDLYTCSDIYIKRIIPKEEILAITNDKIKNSHGYIETVIRFIRDYKWTDDEIEKLKSILGEYDNEIEKVIAYYYEGDKKAFTRGREYGPNNSQRRKGKQFKKH